MTDHVGDREDSSFEQHENGTSRGRAPAKNAKLWGNRDGAVSDVSVKLHLSKFIG